MPLEYTAAALLACLAVVLTELFWLRTGLFRQARYWLTMAVVFAFQVPVDGWLTKLDAPIVLYHPEHITGLRFPWDIPVEDFAFGFALVTLTLALWEHHRSRETAP
ncbi:lycopene cyclase domain-containing protein [Crossiella equi]|uniref:Lycopene cyclase domain-containing protein n=1 Tax=Crossiella equi TaxID=130796 RepID=A0ABS5A7M3_9PSEU|nr:lycopene cyclase domain-containing protein [Crossiella equi]MBP2472571.1 lycopene cyclase domain-containing protein [Crossiella equi]